MLPTPVTEPSTGNGHARNLGGEAKALLRTPIAEVREAKASVVKLTGRTPADPQVGLADQIAALLPTPLSRDGGGRGASVAKYRRDRERGAGPNLDDTMLALSTGDLMDLPSPDGSGSSDGQHPRLWMIEDD